MIMKKNFGFLMLLLALAISFSSCLGGDNENTATYEGQFAVIRTISSTSGISTVAAVSPGYLITGGQVGEYSVGDVIFLSYKINMNNVLSNGAFSADYATVVEGGVFRNSDQKSVLISAANNIPTEDNVFTTVQSPSGLRTEFYSNRWFFGVTAQAKKDQNLDIELYYDENAQNNNGEKLPDNTIVLDLKLIKSVSDLEATDKVSKSSTFVVDLSSLRERFRPTDSTEKSLAIWLRYPVLNTSKEPVYNYLKSSSSSSSTSDMYSFGIYYSKAN